MRRSTFAAAISFALSVCALAVPGSREPAYAAIAQRAPSAARPDKAKPRRAQAVSFDTLILGGSLLDGSGNPSFRADIGIKGDRIAAIGQLAGSTARRRIDAAGKIVSPGFIDIHSHAFDFVGTGGGAVDRRRLAAPNLATQGITTVVINQDGRSPWPIRDQQKTLERHGIGLNTLLLVGHGEVRGRVMGADHRRPARPDEVLKMREMVREGLRDGAFGISAGLEYQPGRWSETDEIVELAREIVPFGGVYISHQRSEGSDPLWYWPSQDPPNPPTVLDAVRETITIGERTGATVVASHIKVKGTHLWGSGSQLVELIERARARGVQVYADQYPYNTTGTDGFTVLIPAWGLSPGATGFATETLQPNSKSDFQAPIRAILQDRARADALRGDIAHEIRRRGGASNIIVLGHPDKSLIGKYLADLAKARGVDEVQMALLLQLEGDKALPGGAHLRGYSMSQGDLDTLAAPRWMATASDALTVPDAPGPGVHPRFFGTFPRKIRAYALDRNIVSLEDVIRSSTSLPAQIMGLIDRGTLRTGAMADIVVFDPKAIKDMATAQQPGVASQGMEWVLVNGRAIIAKGVQTGALPGRVISNRKASRQSGEGRGG